MVVSLLRFFGTLIEVSLQIKGGGRKREGGEGRKPEGGEGEHENKVRGNVRVKHK